MFAFLILLAILFVIVVGVEALARVSKLPLELTRKATHILTGMSVALSARFVEHDYLILLAFLFVIVIAVSRSRGIFKSIHDPNRSGVGDLWYPIGILLAALLFTSAPVFMYAVLILAVSDGLAGLIGKLFGKRRIPKLSAHKTYLGSGVFLVTAFALSLLVLPWPIALAASVYLTLIELLSVRGLDNLILPLAAGVTALAFGS